MVPFINHCYCAVINVAMCTTCHKDPSAIPLVQYVRDKMLKKVINHTTLLCVHSRIKSS